MSLFFIPPDPDNYYESECQRLPLVFPRKTGATPESLYKFCLEYSDYDFGFIYGTEDGKNHTIDRYSLDYDIPKGAIGQCFLGLSNIKPVPDVTFDDLECLLAQDLNLELKRGDYRTIKEFYGYYVPNLFSCDVSKTLTHVEENLLPYLPPPRKPAKN